MHSHIEARRQAGLSSAALSATFSHRLAVIRNTHIGIQLYLLLTEILFLFGPWEWFIPSPSSLYLFFAAIHCSIFIGFKTASIKIYRDHCAGVVYIHKMNDRAFLQIAILVGLIFIIPTSLSRTGVVIPNLSQGFSDLGLAYNENFARLSGGNPYVLVEYFRIFLSPLLIGQIGLIVFYWRALTPSWKLAGLLLVAGATLIYIAIGTNKGLADLIIMAPIFIYLAKVARGDNANAVFNTRNAIFLGAFVIFLLFFGQTQELREGSGGVSGVFYTGNTLIYADSSALPGWISDRWIIIYQSLSAYLTQGYQALALSFDVDRSFTFGFGHSYFLTDQTLLLGVDYIDSNNLPAIIQSQYGWDRYMNWHTAYVWFISDLGYLGTIMLVGGFAHLLFVLMMRLLSDPSVLVVILVQQLLTLFIYLPANNQVFAMGEGLVGTVFVFLVALRLNGKKKLGPVDKGDSQKGQYLIQGGFWGGYRNPRFDERRGMGLP